MRLIDADALNWWDDLFMKGVNQSGVWVRYKDVEHFIKDAPTIDAVPVVRCRECRHNGQPPDKGFAQCELDALIREPEFWCRAGARMDGRREDGDASERVDTP